MNNQRLGATRTTHIHPDILRSKAPTIPSLHDAQIPTRSFNTRFPWHSTVILIAGILLGKFHTQVVYHMKAIVQEARPDCNLGEICAWYEKRPYLENGRLSSSVWDIPRKHLTSNYSALHHFRKGATVNMQSQYPRLFCMSGVLDESEVKLLTSLAKVALAEHQFDANHVQQTVIHVRDTHTDVAELLGKIIRLIGLPSKRYVEELVFRRYHQHTQIKSKAPWCHSGQTNTTSEPFEGCGCAAVALLTLESPEQGGTDVVSGRTADHHPLDEMRVTTQVGDMLTWFVIHPMTERAQQVHHTIQPVLQGTKLVAELHIRNCSWLRNKPRTGDARMKSTRDNESASPSPSDAQLSLENADNVNMDEAAARKTRNDAERLKHGTDTELAGLLGRETVDKCDQCGAHSGGGQ